MPKSNNNDASNKSSKKKKKNDKMRETMASLHREMEVAPKKRISRGESTKRTKRRKKLEKEERHEFLLQVDSTRHTRLRGSQAAYGEEVIQGSLIFPNNRRKSPPKRSRKKSGGDASDPISLEVDDNDGEVADEIEDFAEVQKQVAPEEVEEDEEDHDDEEEDDGEEDGKNDAADALNKKKADAKTKKNERRKRQYRLRNFQSVRMAQRHGDALKYHARGQPGLAIKALKEVARDVPSAPQVYSSLGMVYEDMLNESLKKSSDEEPPQSEMETAENETEAQQSEMDAGFKEKLDLATKAYGSYHVAAILCKQDYTLWVKAAGCAIQAAELHGQATTMKHLSPELLEHNRSERKRWFFEALGDLKVADKLKPPGIEVPAKLAAVHMELGKLSEALTILTDLKNRPVDDGALSEFQSSYKAWMLYADLMLRIGHECIQWNKNVRTNDNYMFRRWLRKLSHSFDWQERRLQALSLALEAAAGSKSIAMFKQWVVQRSMGGSAATERNANMNHPLAPDEIQSNTDDQNAEQTEEQKNEDKKKQFEEEKRLLVEKNRAELEAFDKTTTDINLSGRTNATDEDRDSARDAMIASHKEAVTALESEFNEGNVEGNADMEDKVLGTENSNLPISASCRQVCEIASQLIKHLLGLQLYEGARLAGEGVSAYFMERAARCDKRIRKQRQYDEYQEKLAKSPFMLQSYEEMYGNDSEDEDEVAYLSDDENLDNEAGSELLASLRRGAFPPEMSVLFGLALLGEGGRNYVAAKCIEKIDGLEQESIEWLRGGELESSIAGDPIWGLFQLAMTEPFGRTAAYSFVADFLRKTDKEDQWSNHFAPLFRRHLDTLQSTGLLDAVTDLEDKSSPFVNFRKNQLFKIMVASNKFDVGMLVSPNRGISFQQEKEDMSGSDRTKLAISSLLSMRNFLSMTWKVDNGSISPFCADLVSVCCKCLSFITNECMGELSYSQVYEVLAQAAPILSMFQAELILDVKQPESWISANGKFREFDMYSWDWGPKFPVGSFWQSAHCRALSLTIYNLAVGCNVSLFSGWENEEFNLKLLRRRHGNRHFGVHIHDKRITGYLRKETEDEIARQWKRLHEVFPIFPKLDFEERMTQVKRREWYRNEVEDREENAQNTPIARYREDQGVDIFLAFSSLCLHLAKLETNSLVRNRLIKNVVSVLLPVSQFCVDDGLWVTDIGGAAASVEGFDEWKLLTDLAPEQVQRKASGRQRKKKKEKIIEKKVEEWIKGSDKPVIRSYVKLPTRELRSVWNESEGNQEVLSEEDKKLAQEAMKKVHTAITQVRSCRSEMAIEKASLSVAVALLELASHRACYDTFACLQQAATYASAGLKSGSSDVHFRKALPDVKQCTPREALMILGRADCLQALYFPNESAFLCSYVGKVCRLRRNSTDPALAWNEQWRILAILAFNVSVLIRTTVNTVLDKEMKKGFLSIWERDVVEELEIARRDGWRWKQRYVSSKTGKEVAVDEEADDEEEDEGDDSDMEDAHQDTMIDGSEEVVVVAPAAAVTAAPAVPQLPLEMETPADGVPAALPNLSEETLTSVEAAVQSFVANELDFQHVADEEEEIQIVSV